jgi:hypothetical protein
MQCPTIKSFFLSFGIGFFFKHIKYIAFLVEKNEKNTFLNEFSTKKFELPYGPRFS